MPDDYQLVNPVFSDSFSRSEDDIAVEWSPIDTAATITIEVLTSCQDGGFESYTQTLNSDTGTALIPAGDLESFSLEGSCTSTISVSKNRLGTFDSTFRGGIISAHQLRSVSVSTLD